MCAVPQELVRDVAGTNGFASQRFAGRLDHSALLWLGLRGVQKFVHAAEEGDNDEIARIISEVNGTFPLRYMRDKVCRHFA